MKINFLILAHSNFQHLNRLIETLDEEGVNFFVHIDKKSKEQYHSNKSNVHIIKDRVKVYWSGFGMIEATLKLLRLAQSTINEGYYCLLSGADYPIRPNSYIKKILSGDLEFMNILSVPAPGKPMNRFEYYYFNYDRSVKTFFPITLGIIERVAILLKIKRPIPFKIFAGSQWFAITNNCVKHILTEVEENPKYIQFFKKTKMPDEAFFQTIIGNSSFLRKTQTNLTYTDWSTNPSPAIMNDTHLDLFINQLEFVGTYGKYLPIFARKFNDESELLIRKIEATIRKTMPGQ